MLAIGRDPITGPLNLDAVGVKYDKKSGKIVWLQLPSFYNLPNIITDLFPSQPVNADDSTNIPNIYAVGDVVQDRLELTPVAIQTGKLLARRLFAGSSELLGWFNSLLLLHAMLNCRLSNILFWMVTDHKMVPVTVYTPLEYGTIGYSEEDAIVRKP